MQEGHPIAYFSEILSIAKLNYPVYGKNCMHLLEFLRFGNITCGQKNLS
jgi:hypothetical protein